MIKSVETKREAVRDVCRKYGVMKLEVFGSAAEGAFSTGNSDVDLLVEFLPGVSLGPWLGHYFDLRDELARVFGCAVDLVMASALRSPHFIREVNRTRQLLYAA